MEPKNLAVLLKISATFVENSKKNDGVLFRHSFAKTSDDLNGFGFAFLSEFMLPKTKTGQ